MNNNAYDSSSSPPKILLCGVAPCGSHGHVPVAGQSVRCLFVAHVLLQQHTRADALNTDAGKRTTPSSHCNNFSASTIHWRNKRVYCCQVREGAPRTLQSALRDANCCSVAFLVTGSCAAGAGTQVGLAAMTRTHRHSAGRAACGHCRGVLRSVWSSLTPPHETDGNDAAGEEGRNVGKINSCYLQGDLLCNVRSIEFSLC